MIGHAYSNLTEDTVNALKLCLGCLESQRPREVRRQVSEAWLLFTDARYEPDSLLCKPGMGGVLVNAFGQLVQFFSTSLTDDLVAAINLSRRKITSFLSWSVSPFCVPSNVGKDFSGRVLCGLHCK